MLSVQIPIMVFVLCFFVGEVTCYLERLMYFAEVENVMETVHVLMKQQGI